MCCSVGRLPDITGILGRGASKEFLLEWTERRGNRKLGRSRARGIVPFFVLAEAVQVRFFAYPGRIGSE
jgi:hypothetical protein